MKRVKDFKINEEQLKNLTFSKIMIEETLHLMNFLVQNKVLTNNIELENFKERIATIKELIELALRDYSDKTITEMIYEEISEIRKITNKNISRKYREILKDYISELLNKLKEIQLEDIAIQYNKKVYCINEIEEIYKYI